MFRLVHTRQESMVKVWSLVLSLLVGMIFQVPDTRGDEPNEKAKTKEAGKPEEIDELHDKTRELYVVQLDSKVKWVQNSLIGIAVSGTENYINAFDARSGQVYWQKEIPEIQKEAVTIVADMAVVRMDKGDYKEHPVSVAFSLVTGEEKWTNRDVTGKILLAIPLYGEGKMFVIASDEAILGTAGMMAMKVADKAIKTFTLGLGGKDISKKEFKPDSYYIDMENGTTIWRMTSDDEILFHATPVGFMGLGGMEYGVKAYPAPTFNSDYSSLYLPYMGLECIDMKTGQRKWLAKYKTMEGNLLQTNAQSIPDVGSGIIYTSARGKIRAVEIASGKVKWETKQDYGVAPEMVLSKGEGLLYCRTGGKFRENKTGKERKSGKLGIVAINTSDGSEKWEYKHGKGEATNMVDEGDHLVFIGDRNIVAVDKATGKERFRKKTKLPEDAESLELRTDGKVTLQSDNNLGVYDPSKQDLVWDTFVKAPGLSFWDRMLLLGIDWIGAELGKQIKSQDVSRYFKQAVFKVTKELGDRMVQRASMGGSEEAKRNIYFPAALKDGMKGIAVVNKETGARETDIVFGKENFGYQVDERFTVAYKYTSSKVFGIELSLLKQ